MFLKLPNFHTYENGNNYNGSYNGMRFAIVINKNEDTKDAANRRLKEEMGIYSNLREIFSFIYYVKFDNNLIEHEFDHVFFGKYNGSIKFNPIEVEDYKWISLDKLKTDIKKDPEKYTFWFAYIMNNHFDDLKIALNSL